MYQPERKYEAQSARHELNVIRKYSTSNRLVQNHIIHTLGTLHFNWGLGLRDNKRPMSRSTGLSVSGERGNNTLRVACHVHGTRADCGCQAALHKVHHRVHNSPQLIPIISRSNSVHAIFFDVRPILILVYHLILGLESVLFTSSFPAKTL